MKQWRVWHKWLGMVVGVQVLLWISGGVVMSAIPLDIVRGEHVIGPAPGAVPPADANELHLPLNQFSSVSWQFFIDRTVLKVKRVDGAVDMLDPYTGLSLPTLDPVQATNVAQSRYLGGASVLEAELLHTIPAEVNHLSGAFYRVTFDDWSNTRFYVNAQTAEVRSVRSDIWQFYDFFWMLHIMDYDTRKDFNNPLLIVAAVIALGFTLSGLVLIYFALLQPKTRKLLYHLGLRHKSA